MVSGFLISIFLGSFVLEDVALATAVTLSSAGKLDPALAFGASFSGIALGDVAIYWAGRVARRLPSASWLPKRLRRVHARQRQPSLLASMVFFCRFIPGARTLTYFVAGLLGFSALSFAWITLVSTAIWVGSAFLLGALLASLLRDHWILIASSLLLGYAMIRQGVELGRQPWRRKARFHFWRKWRSFEFWPAWLFYLPIVPCYVFLALRHRTLFAPFYANPRALNGGLIGESKWDFLRHLDESAASTLKAFKIPRGARPEDVRRHLLQAGIATPFILKPDVGQRGFGVRVVETQQELDEYLSLIDAEVIAQTLSRFGREAGIFYVRMPDRLDGFIFSVTDKRFPSVVGDGVSSLGDLILRDRRARIIADVYFSRFEGQLDEVPAQNRAIALARCGNHCQGAIFLNGEALITDALTKAIDDVAKQIPEFYFGRFDVRYESEASLRRGEFEVVEINGAGSEATHIWDADTRLIDAYRTLFRQWALLFEIGARVRSRGAKGNVAIPGFLKEIAKVALRREPLSISS